MNKEIKALNIITIFIALWIVLSPFILAYHSLGNISQQFIAGLAIILFAIARLTIPNASWANWANLLVGVWLIISPAVTFPVPEVARWNGLITGILVALIAYRSAAITIKRQIPQK